jgi:hypothetical protein
MAAVHLVCADLLISGFRCFVAGEGLRYDVVIDVGHRLFRIQVKGTKGLRVRPSRPNTPPLYRFVTRRNGDKEQNFYSDADVDIIACVAMDVRRIAYFPVTKAFPKILHVHPVGTKSFIRKGVEQRLVIDRFPIDLAMTNFLEGLGVTGLTHMRRARIK